VYHPFHPTDHHLFFFRYPHADIPVIQLSIDNSFDPKLHFKIGESLSSLRKEGILLIGSGSATHNLTRLGMPNTEPPEWATDFMGWLTKALQDVSKRVGLLQNIS